MSGNYNDRRLFRSVWKEGATLFSSLFRRKKQLPKSKSGLGETIVDARVGDVITISGLHAEYEDAYLIVEKFNRYESSAGGWRELLCVDDDRRIWIQWSEQGGLYVTVNSDQRPMGLSQLGIDVDELMRIDEEQSLDNYVICENVRYHYRNSYEAFYHENNTGEGQGFLLFDMVSGDGLKVLSIVKFEEAPFEVQVGEVVSPETITVYKQ